MSKAFKILGGIVFLLIAVAVAGVAILSSMDFNEYKGLIAEEAKKATGRDLTFAGDLNLKISLTPSLAVEGVTFSNASWGSRPEMVKLKRLAVEVNLMPLLSSKVVVDRIVLEGLDLLAETDASGKGNWVFDTGKAEKAAEAPSADAGGGGGGVLPVVKKVYVRDVNITYKDGKTGETLKLALDSLDVGADSLDSPVKIALKGSFNGVGYQASGQVGAVSALMAGKPYDIALTAEAVKASLGIDGSVADPMQAKGLDFTISVKGAELTDTVQAAAALAPALKELALPAIGPYDISSRISGSPDKLAVSDIKVSVGKAEQVLVGASGKVADPLNAKGIDLNFSVEGKDIAPFEKTAGAELPKLPPFKVSGRLSDGGGGYAVDGLKLDIGGSNLSGKLAVALGGARPSVNAELASTLLDLDKLLPKGKEAPPAPAPDKGKGDGRVFPDDPLPLDGLKAADAKVKFNGKRIVVQGIEVADVVVDLSLSNGNLQVNPFGLVVSGGKINGNVLLDASKPSPPLALRVDAKQIDYGALLAKFGQNDIATGKVDLDIDIKGAGASVRKLMAGLDGKTRIVTEGGKIKSGMLNILSADVVSALPFVDSKGDKDIQCGVIDFRMKQGMADAKAIVFETGGLSLVGKGNVNLGSEALDLNFDPRAKKVSIMKLAMVPFDVSGTMASPSVMPNVGGAAVGAVTGAVSTVKGIASGGLNAVGSLVGAGASQQETDETDYCNLALAGKPLVAKKSPAPNTAAPPPEQKPSVVEDAAKGVTEGIGGAVKGIGGAIGGLLGGKK